jgi:hypothetical protein
MKAAHRKELQTNVLADRMGRLLDNVKSGPKSASVVAWIFVILALIVFGTWSYYGRVSPEDDSTRWVLLREMTNIPDSQRMRESMEKLLEKDPGTVQTRVARFQLARLCLREGQDSFASFDRPRAIDDLRAARTHYEALIRETSDNPMLHQEALLGAATAEEALAGVPAEPADAAPGSLDRALEYYLRLVQFSLKQLGKPVTKDQAVATMELLVQEQLQELGESAESSDVFTRYKRLADYSPEKFKGNVQKWRDLSYLGRTAARRAKELQLNRDEVVAFYGDLNKLAAPPKVPPDIKPAPEPMKP